LSETESDKSDASAPKSKQLGINLPDHSSDSESDGQAKGTIKQCAPLSQRNDSTLTNDSEESSDYIAYKSTGKRVTFSKAAADLYAKVVTPVANASFTSKLKNFFFGAPSVPTKTFNPVEKVEEQYRTRTPTAPQLIQTSSPRELGISSSLPIQGNTLGENLKKKFSSAENVLILSPTSSSVQPSKFFLTNKGPQLLSNNEIDDFYTPHNESVKEEFITSPTRSLVWEDYNPTPYFYRNQSSQVRYSDLSKVNPIPPQPAPSKTLETNPNTLRFKLYDEPSETELINPELLHEHKINEKLASHLQVDDNTKCSN